MKKLTLFVCASMLISLVGLNMIFVGSATAKPISHTITLSNINWTSGGVSGVGSDGTGTIAISGIGSSSVVQALLYWHGIDQTSNGGDGVYDNANISIDGNGITGVNIGDSTTNCWGPGSSTAYRADVTAFVTGDGSYAIAGMAAKAGHSANGASLIVTFDDGNDANNRDLAIFEGNDSDTTGFPGEDLGWHSSLPGINYNGGPVFAELHLADGQAYGDGPVTYATANGSLTIPDTVAIYDGISVPDEGNGRLGFGQGLYDVEFFDITSAFGGIPGTVTLNMDGQDTGPDCLGLIVLALDLEPGSAPPALLNITLAPPSAVNCVNEDHTMVATVVDDSNAPVVGRDVNFLINSGPNSGLSSTIVTDSAGVASWTYSSLNPGVDNIQACFVDDNSEQQCAFATKTWEICNEPPDCSAAVPTPKSCLWPPNHKYRSVNISGVTDPDGDPIIISIASITSDEPTATALGAGGGLHAPDAMGIGTDTALIRAERSGLGNGRWYEINFTADDGNGGTCVGSVAVQVPHDDEACDAIDDGQQYDATQ